MISFNLQMKRSEFRLDAAGEFGSGITAVFGPSGAGKTSLVKEISSKNSFSISISHTTRKPRINEVDGVDYFFITNDEFKKLISTDSSS